MRPAADKMRVSAPGRQLLVRQTRGQPRLPAQGHAQAGQGDDDSEGDGEQRQRHGCQERERQQNEQNIRGASLEDGGQFIEANGSLAHAVGEFLQLGGERESSSAVDFSRPQRNFQGYRPGGGGHSSGDGIGYRAHWDSISSRARIPRDVFPADLALRKTSAVCCWRD